jgi:hypothetical protein
MNTHLTTNNVTTGSAEENGKENIVNYTSKLNKERDIWKGTQIKNASHVKLKRGGQACSQT